MKTTKRWRVYEHTYSHLSNKAVNKRNGNQELWLLDVYKARFNAFSNEKKLYAWANTADEAASILLPLVDEDADNVLLTHIEPINDRQREPV